MSPVPPGATGFSPRPRPDLPNLGLIATYPTRGPAVALSRGLDRDRAVDESGNQLVVFGRRGSGPLTGTAALGPSPDRVRPGQTGRLDHPAPLEYTSPMRITGPAALFLLALAHPTLALTEGATCMKSAGGAARSCLDEWLATVERCRSKADAACEASARAEDGPLDTLTAAAEAATASCPEAVAIGLGYQGQADVGIRSRDACRDWGEAFLTAALSTTAGLSGKALSCQRTVAKAAAKLRRLTVASHARCYLQGANDKRCNRTKRDRTVDKATTATAKRLDKACNGTLSTLNLGTSEEIATTVRTLGTHFAQLAYPPNDLGPTAELGPHPVGLRTVDLADAARMNVQGSGPRPVRVEIYYPTTSDAVAGVPRDRAKVLGVEVATLPAWRDVALRDGRYPLVVFSHGNGGIRIQSFFFAAHLASHGFIVVSPDHHGNTFEDGLSGLVDPNVAANRPRDMSFVIDQMLAFSADPQSLWYEAIDAGKIGASGHSFGGYTSFALAGPAFNYGGADGTFTDTRVKAIFPQAPFSPFPNAFYQAITIPVLIVGGTIDETTPFVPQQEGPWNALPSGAAVIGLAEVTAGGHFTFSDFCEVDRALLGFLGGFSEACEPRHLPFRHAHDLTNYLSLNFFDAVLNGNAEARARLTALTTATGAVDDLVYREK